MVRLSSRAWQLCGTAPTQPLTLTSCLAWQAPELFMQYYGLESDLWALGIMLYQVPTLSMES